MATHFFDRNPASWQELETMIELAFTEMGYESKRAYKLETVRGSVEIDVYAVKRSTPIPTTVLCECKHWDTPVPQNVRSVCADSGAHFGLIISKKGFQRGAETTRLATNVHLMDFSDFQTTFFEEWRRGVFMILVRMRDHLLPILRAAAGHAKYGTDLIDTKKLEGIDPFNKYSIFSASMVGIQTSSFTSSPSLRHLATQGATHAQLPRLRLIRIVNILI